MTVLCPNISSHPLPSLYHIPHAFSTESSMRQNCTGLKPVQLKFLLSFRFFENITYSFRILLESVTSVFVGVLWLLTDYIVDVLSIFSYKRPFLGSQTSLTVISTLDSPFLQISLTCFSHPIFIVDHLYGYFLFYSGVSPLDSLPSNVLKQVVRWSIFHLWYSFLVFLASTI